MKFLVQKFGGTSVSTESRRKFVVEKVKAAIDEGFSPVVIVSAMGRKGEPYATDTLLSLLDDKFKEENKQATDLLMSCGEIISAVVMSNELNKVGLKAMPLTGGQAGILTNDDFTNATSTNVDITMLSDITSKGYIPVITGFQGMTKEGFITTLGRGGSDTSASLIGVALNAHEIQIYTDVDGIMTADPRIVEDASLIDVISYSEVFQLADQGAKVIHPKAVEIAMRGNVPLVIKNTMNNCSGTLINSIGDSNSTRIITGITYLNNRIQVSIKLEDNQGNPHYKELLDIVANNDISLDLINIFPKEKIFTIDSSKKNMLETIFKNINIKYTLIENCSKISVIGSRMAGIPGVMAKIIKALSDSNIDVLQTADSHSTIWCLIESDKVNEATNILHQTFQL
ncbi:aspartate kinase [Clostridium paridis]|uniref:Aspartokinase n=1 Tax=Clostridium paridis TaxID=2803863 RepID=A0A937FB81_9CLOT|nr:aspartate kinase [Clostridium paridis]MBL4930890.1 aspartate kinase [Clostridium paridis]